MRERREEREREREKKEGERGTYNNKLTKVISHTIIVQ